jgi:hypothetical protein
MMNNSSFICLQASNDGPDYSRILYMHQTVEGPNHNQVNIADPKQPQMFGYTNVHDYPIYDGLSPSAKIVARAQGLHTETNMNDDDWFHWSSIVFSDERFGHTLNTILLQNVLLYMHCYVFMFDCYGPVILVTVY